MYLMLDFELDSFTISNRHKVTLCLAEEWSIAVPYVVDPKTDHVDFE